MIVFDLPPAECPAVFYQQIAFSHDSAVFDEAFEHILDVEGSEYFPDDPSRYGVTGPELARFLGTRERITPERIAQITEAEAKQLYYKLYWTALRINEIRSKVIAIAVLDQTVHRGAFGGITFLQRFINAYEAKEVVTVTGFMNNQTLKYLEGVKEKQFMGNFTRLAEKSYRNMVRVNPKKRRYLQSWVNRAHALVRQARD